MSNIIKSIVKELFEEEVDGVTFFPKNEEEIELINLKN